MSWKIRHEGSPRSIEGLELPQVLEGLQDGLWEPTDEVVGPGEVEWLAIENHPQLAEGAAEVEPPPAKPHDDETRLDMNALIDVCLVLLIFFILTTSYAALQKILDAPTLTAEAAKTELKRVSPEQVKELMIYVKVRMENGAPVIRVEDEVVARQDLMRALNRFTKGGAKDRKNEILLEHDDDVPHGVNVAIWDAAKGAGVEKIHNLAPEGNARR